MSIPAIDSDELAGEEVETEEGIGVTHVASLAPIVRLVAKRPANKSA